jgi:hypothetical protein
MEIFAMHAHVLGETRLVAVSNDGSGLTINRDGDLAVAHSVDQAISSARAYIGDLLIKAQRPEQVWSLTVRIGTITVPYGAQPPITVIPRGGRPIPRTDVISRIFADYQEGDGPRKALDNAVRIVRAVTSSHRAAA